jgi:hypothetical protein
MFVECIADIRIERIIPPTKHKIKITMEYILSSSESKSHQGLLIIEKIVVIYNSPFKKLKYNLFFTNSLFVGWHF